MNNLEDKVLTQYAKRVAVVEELGALQEENRILKIRLEGVGRRQQVEKKRFLDKLAKFRGQRNAAIAEREALRAELVDLAELKAYATIPLRERAAERITIQSRLAQATAIIDYLWLHTEPDAIAKSDIDKFYAGSTDAEKAARAEMVRVANEPSTKSAFETLPDDYEV